MKIFSFYSFRKSINIAWSPFRNVITVPKTDQYESGTSLSGEVLEAIIKFQLKKKEIKYKFTHLDTVRTSL